jgi:RES domain-containing protein
LSRISVWRIVDRRYAASAFDGAGAEITGGRFNSRGTKVVYTSDSLSLALLETLVRVNKRERLRNQVCIRAEFDSRHVTIIDTADLPEDWDSIPPVLATRHVGDAWIESGVSLVLQVPSVVIPQQSNYLINPSHRSMSKLKIFDPIRVPIDDRLDGLLAP